MITTHTVFEKYIKKRIFLEANAKTQCILEIMKNVELLMKQIELLKNFAQPGLEPNRFHWPKLFPFEFKWVWGNPNFRIRGIS